MAITNVPQYANSALRVKVEVTEGINQLQRALGMGIGLYQMDGSSIDKQSVEIQANGVFQSNPVVSYSTLVITTNLPLTLNGVDLDGNFITINIQKVLVYDSPLKKFTLANGDSTGKARVQVFSLVAQVAPVADVFYYGAAVPPSSYSSTFVKSLTTVQGTKNRQFNANAANDQKLYYCYPAVLGESNFTVNGFTGGFVLVSTTQVIMDSGTVDYYVYESDYAGLGNTYVTVSDA